MKIWIVTEGDCQCCMYTIAVFSTEEKARDYKTDSKYVDIDWYIVDEEESNG